MMNHIIMKMLKKQKFYGKSIDLSIQIKIN